MAGLECQNCCYYAASEENPREHCCFTEWGHRDEEIAPCDDDHYYEDEYDPAFFDESPDIDEM